MITSKRAAVVAALIGFALVLAGCFDDEQAQRKAFIEFLQTRIIDKPGLHIPIMSDQDVANFGPYADQYRIMNGFHHQLEAAVSGDFVRAMQIGSPRSVEDLVQHRAMLPIVTQGMAKMKTAVDKALADADAAHAALKQPPDLKVVYDKAYEHMVTKPANVIRELIPIMVSGLPVIEKLAAFLDEHRNAIEYRGGMPFTRDARLRPQLDALMQEAVRVSEASNEGKRKLRAMAEGK
jgi:hypothetical protein